jgi:DNA-binding Lrp family transcriptional regulator
MTIFMSSTFVQQSSFPSMLMCTNVSIFMEKCLYNIRLFEQTFKEKDFGKGATRSLKLETNTLKKIDKLDLRILSLLQEDCRLSFNKIANELDVSVGTAFNHVKSLEKRGVLKGYTAVLDSSKLGYNLTVIIMIQAEGTYLTDVENEIAKTSNVVALYDITGDYDAVAIAKFKDRASLSAFIKNLLSTPHLKRTLTNMALNVVKEDLGVKL